MTSSTNPTLPAHGPRATGAPESSRAEHDAQHDQPATREAHAGDGFRDRFHHFAARFAFLTGTPWAFLIACLVIVVWAVTGPLFHFSDTWQLVINTGTTIVTFIMVFLIQNTQNRDARAIHLKLDELIKINGRARNKLVDLENWTEQELEELEREFHRLRARGGPKRTDPHVRRAP